MGFLGFTNFSELVLFFTSIVSGMVILLGLNAVNATPPFMLEYYKYIKHDEHAVSDYPNFWRNVLTYYCIVTEVTQAVLQPVNLLPFFRRFSYLFRLELGCMISMMELLITLLMPHIGASESGAVVGILMAAFVGGLGRAIFENTVFALFGTCPPKIIIGAMIGVPASGVLMSVLQIILIGCMPSNFKSVFKQSIIYFSIGIGLITVSVLLLILLFFNKFAKGFIPELRSTRSAWRNIYRPLKLSEELPQNDPSKISLKNEHGSTHEAGNDATSSPQLDIFATTDSEPKKQSSSPQDDTNIDPEGLISTELLQRVRLWDVIKKIYTMQIACFLNFFVTLLIFPGVFLKINFTDIWYTTLVIAIFNFTDFISRGVLIWKKLRISRKMVLILSIARIALIPLVILCGMHIIPGKMPGYILSGILGISNGYVGTLSMMYAPTSPGLRGNGDHAMAAQACDGALMLGCSLGALSQLGVVLAF
ncbi:unnamed protein product [Phytomonas sp. Hart1]|nr:unnamed protein product [Phytomonas sp. Hart1]|eukprot:CCW68332.1 unnamed protein product [Phytomonas sp. isolate Hart1]